MQFLKFLFCKFNDNLYICLSLQADNRDGCSSSVAFSSEALSHYVFVVFYPFPFI